MYIYCELEKQAKLAGQRTWQYDTELCCYRRPIKSSLGSVSNTVDAAVCNNLCKLIELAWQVTYLSMKH